MAWDEKRSRERIAAHLESMGKIEIEDLAREADLETLLTETRCRRIEGAHAYAEISNFPSIVSTATGDDLREAVRALNIWQRRAIAIAEDTFDGVFVHFQGPRMHVLFYRPYDEQQQATRAVLLLLALDDLARMQFNPRFSALADFRVRSGCDIGTVVGTRNGVNGDRELLFVGDPANWAAKIITGRRRITVTQRIVDALPSDIAQYAAEPQDEGGPRVVSCTSSELANLLKAYGFDYNAAAHGQEIDRDIDALDLEDVGISGARVRIDLDSLSVRNNKLVTGASVFGDIDGFTAYVTDADAESDEDVVEALRVFAAIRKELAFVVKRDHAGVRVQYQGDRTQALVHLPDGDEAGIAEEGVRIAAAMQSSFEITLKEALPAANPLKLAVGVDIGTTLASKLGAHGQRDRICIGDPVDGGAAIQQACDGDEVGISSATYHAIRKSWQKLFDYDADRRFYVAKALRAEKLDLADLAEAFDSKNVHIGKAAAAAVVAPAPFVGSMQVTPSRSWSDR
jgi:class 3 adenylate cyclase